MPNACGTLSLAFDGVSVNAELWGATTLPIPLGAEPNRYRILLLIQLSPYGLYQITRQSQMDFADQRLLLENVDYELFMLLHQAFITSENVMELVNACDTILYKRMEQCAVSDACSLHKLEWELRIMSDFYYDGAGICNTISSKQSEEE